MQSGSSYRSILTFSTDDITSDSTIELCSLGPLGWDPFVAGDEYNFFLGDDQYDPFVLDEGAKFFLNNDETVNFFNGTSYV